MDKKALEKINDELLSNIGGGRGLSASDKQFLEAVMPLYRKKCPDVSLEEFLDRTVRKTYPQLNIEAASEEDITEIKAFLADFWK